MTYVLSDVHGDRQAFVDILRKISFTDADDLYIIGDVIDRGEHGIWLLSRILRRKNMHLLLGNHEQMMVRAFVGKQRKKNASLWKLNGGEPTRKAFKALPEEEQEAILRALIKLPVELDLTVGGRDFRLVHAAPSECMWQPSEGGEKFIDPEDFCVWGRIDTDSVWLPGKTVLFGHTPTVYYGSPTPPEIVFMDGKIALDCGMASGPRYGRLGCLRLDDLKVFYSS